MLTAIATICVFGIMIFFHELGHYSVAKLVGVRVIEFSLGFGPKVYGFTKSETVYNLRVVPLGGFVRMAGMDNNDDELDPDDESNFNKKTVGQRAAVILAGPIMNFVLAALLIALIFLLQGVGVPNTVIREMLPDYPAASSELMVGDRVVAVDRQRLNDWDSFSLLVSGMPEQEITITVERGSVERDIVLVTKRDTDGKGKIGITPEVEYQREGVITSAVLGFKLTGRIIVMSIDYLGKMFRGREAVDVGGPVRIVDEISKAANQGFFRLLEIAAVLSINLGMINLFPIPALDGSRVLFLTWEKIYGRPVDPSKENYIHLVGFACLILLMVAITFNDVLRLIAP